jgi:hypothetical protein
MKASVNWAELGKDLETKISTPDAAMPLPKGAESIAMRKISTMLKESRKTLEKKFVSSSTFSISVSAGCLTCTNGLFAEV